METGQIKKQQTLLEFINPEKLKETEQEIEELGASLPPSNGSDDAANSEPSDFPPKYDMQKTQEVVKKITEIFNHINYSFAKFLDIALAAVEGRENDYMELIKGMDRKELDDYVKCYGDLYNFFIDGYYDDVLGNYYQQNYKSSNGYFITPFHASLMIAEMIGINPEDTVSDPACGSGSMLLAAKYVIHKNYGWKASCYFVPKIYGQDINNTYVKMCKLQLYLSNYLYMIGRTYDAVKDMLKNSPGSEVSLNQSSLAPV